MKVEAKGIVKAIKQGSIVTFLEVHPHKYGYEYNVYNSNYMKETTGRIYSAMDLYDAFDIICDDHLFICVDFIINTEIDYVQFMTCVKTMEDSINYIREKNNLILNLDNLNTTTEQEINERIMLKLVEKYDGNWKKITERETTLTESFICQYKEKVNWNLLSSRPDLSEYIIDNCLNNVLWNIVSKYHDLTDKFIDKYKCYLNWSILCKRPMPEDLIRRYEDLVDWKAISKYQTLSEDFMKEYICKIDARQILEHQVLSENFIRENIQIFDHMLSVVFRTQKMSEEFIEEILDKTNCLMRSCAKRVLDYICIFQNVSENFIRKYSKYINWQTVSRKRKLTIEFIRDFQSKLEWFYVTENHVLTIEFIREFQDRLDWNYVTRNQELSESFIREFHDRLDWNYISEYQTLSESIIREFQDKVNWEYVSRYQKLSDEFIDEFQDRLYWYYLTIENRENEDFIRKFKHRIFWNVISYEKLSQKFIQEIKDYIY